MRKISIVAASLALLFSMQEGSAQSPSSGQQPNAYLLQHLVGGITLERYLQAVRLGLARLDADSNGILDAADIELHNGMSAATYRTSFATRIMMADLNGDNAVTEDELRRKLHYDQRQMAMPTTRPATPTMEERIEQEVRKFMAADVNHDGRITWDEAIELAKKQPDYPRPNVYGLSAGISQLLTLAPVGKTAITFAEIDEAATALFRKVDADNNGTISLDELQVSRNSLIQANAQASLQRTIDTPRVVCDAPKASDAAKLILLGAYQTESLSNVTLGSQDQVVGVGNVVVEPGPDPLYIAIATYQPTIWRFYGATERVERVVVMSNGAQPDRATPNVVSLAGVVGLPADRTSFPQAAGCLRYFYVTPSTESAIAGGAIKAAAGKTPDVVAGKYAMIAFNVPSGKVESTGQVRSGGLQIVQGGTTYRLENGKMSVVKPDQNVEQSLDRFHPGGVVTIDAKTVVASAKAEPYEVLPQEAGLSQLVKSGVLTRNENGEFLINKKTRLPAGLTGSHSVKFLLRRDVPKPEGHPGHSTVISEETGETVKFELAH
jgi:Ca2+-binding EF-hand superfamily protein